MVYWGWSLTRLLDPQGLQVEPLLGRMWTRAQNLAGAAKSFRRRVNSIHGLIVSAWTNNVGAQVFSLAVTVPANSTARIYFPSTNLLNIMESGASATNTPGLLVAPQVTNGASLFQVGSGKYTFSDNQQLYRLSTRFWGVQLHELALKILQFAIIP